MTRAQALISLTKIHFKALQKKNKTLDWNHQKQKSPYASEPLVTKGYFRCKLGTTYKITVQKCYVVNKEKVGNILGLETAKDLNIIKLQDVNKILETSLWS